MRCILWMLLWTVGVMQMGCERIYYANLDVRVVDHQQKPLARAEIRLSDHLLGYSDEEGHFRGTFPFRRGQKKRLEVFFEKDSVVYGPYVRTFRPTVTSAEPSLLKFYAILPEWRAYADAMKDADGEDEDEDEEEKARSQVEGDQDPGDGGKNVRQRSEGIALPVQALDVNTAGSRYTITPGVFAPYQNVERYAEFAAMSVLTASGPHGASSEAETETELLGRFPAVPQVWVGDGGGEEGGPEISTSLSLSPFPLSPQTLASGSAPSPFFGPLPQQRSLREQGPQAASSSSVVAVDKAAKAKEEEVVQKPAVKTKTQTVGKSTVMASAQKALKPSKTSKEQKKRNRHKRSVAKRDSSADVMVAVWGQKHGESGLTVPLEGAQVLVGYRQKIHHVCTTDGHGHCPRVNIMHSQTPQVLDVIVMKKGYITTTQKMLYPLRRGLQITLQAGPSWDVFALRGGWNGVQGVGQVAVYRGAALLGYTNALGHFSLAGDLLDQKEVVISLKSTDMLPQSQQLVFQRDGHGITVVPYVSRDPHRYAVVVLPSRWTMASQPLRAQHGVVLDRTLRNYLFRYPHFSRLGKDFAMQHHADHSLDALAFRGFVGSALEGWAQGLVGVDVYEQKEDLGSLLVVAFSDACGEVLAGNVCSFDFRGRRGRMESEIMQCMEGMIHGLPLVMGVDDVEAGEGKGDLRLWQVAVGMTEEVAESMPEGGRWQLWRWQRSSQHSGPGSAGGYASLLQPIFVSDLQLQGQDERERTLSVAISSQQEMRVGDQMVWVSDEGVGPWWWRQRMRSQQMPQGREEVVLRVVGEKQEPLAGVVVYDGRQQRWRISDGRGQVLWPQRDVGTLLDHRVQFLYPGYRSEGVTPVGDRVQKRGPRPSYQVRLVRDRLFLRVAAQVPAARVEIANTYEGDSPLHLALPRQDWQGQKQIALRVWADGYLEHRVQVPLSSAPFMDLTAGKALALERDYQAEYVSLLSKQRSQQQQQAYDEKKIEALLKAIPPHHVQYIPVHHQHATYLYEGQRYAQAVALWQQLSLQPVFIRSEMGSIGMAKAGMASFQLAEQFDQRKSFIQSRKLYEQSLRFFREAVSMVQLAPAWDRDVAYHWALAQHRIGLIAKSDQALKQAAHRWRIYLRMTQGQEGAAQQRQQARMYAQELAQNEVL